MKKVIWQILSAMAGLSWLNWLLPYLMFLVVLGTVAQADMGLYEAQKWVFEAWVLWLGPLPLPGMASIILLLTLNLLVRFLFFSGWQWHKIGITLSHLGILVLLIGGLWTAGQAREGFLVITEGRTSATVHSYHDRRLLVADGQTLLLNIPITDLKKGNPIALSSEYKNKVIEILEIHPHADYQKRSEINTDKLSQIDIVPLPPLKEQEANRMALSLRIGSNDVHLHEDSTQPAGITLEDGRKIQMALRRHVEELPFSLELTDFQQELYPGTGIASAYMSYLKLHDNTLAIPVAISMNKPLRYQGYTFYQSSFERPSDGPEVTVLSVVYNSGRLLPYVATGIIFLGLLLHACIRAVTLRGRSYE